METNLVIDHQTATVAVDMQNDFGHPAGSLFVTGGDKIVDTVNTVMALARLRIFTRDQHPGVTNHFDTFPPHCIRGTWGAEYMDGLNTAGGVVISKGTEPDVDDFSGCDGFTQNGESIDQILTASGIKRVVVCGLATDYCDLATVLDLLKLGYDVYVVVDAIAAVNVAEGDGDRAIAQMTAAGATMVTAKELLAAA